MNKQEMKDIIQHSFATDSKVGFACMNIYHYLLNEDLDNLKYITFNDLQKVSNVDQSILYEAITYLSGEKAPILSIGYEYIDGDDIFEISQDELSKIYSEGTFYFDGKPVLNWQSKVYIYFYASEFWKGLE